MQAVMTFARSSLGAKVVMALTGAGLVLYVFAHMAGNLSLFAGPDAINSYAAMLKSNQALLWTMRGLLLVAIPLHAFAGLRLAAMNRGARPERYRRAGRIQSKLGTRTMALSGLTLLAFIIFHIMHLTLGVTHPEHFNSIDVQGRHDVYSMVVLGFQQPAVAWSYIVANVLLALHLSHGIASMFQSLGLTGSQYSPTINKVGPVMAVVLFVGNVSMPIAVMAGVIKLGGH